MYNREANDDNARTARIVQGQHSTGGDQAGPLFVEELGLRAWHATRLTARLTGGADNTQHLNFGDGRPRNEEPQVVAVNVRRRELDSVIEQFEQVVRDD